MKNLLPSRLEEIRGGRTQKDFAHLIGVPLNTYTNWVREIRQPSTEWLIAICTRLGVSADWLLGLSDDASASAERPRPARPLAAGVSDRATYDPPAARSDPDESYWRDLVASQQATIAELTRLVAEGRITPAAAVRTGGRGAVKSA